MFDIVFMFSRNMASSATWSSAAVDIHLPLLCVKVPQYVFTFFLLIWLQALVAIIVVFDFDFKSILVIKNMIILQVHCKYVYIRNNINISVGLKRRMKS